MKKVHQILIGLAILQGALFLFGLLKSELQDDKPSKPLLDFGVEQIIGLEVQPASKTPSPFGPLTLEKTSDAWTLVGSEGYPVESEKVEKVLTLLTKIDAEAPVTLSKESHSTLNVSPSAFTKKATLSTKDNTIELFIGEGSGRSIYVRKADEDAVYLTRDATAFEISHEVTSYAEAQYFELNDLKEVNVTLRARGQQKIRLYQGTDGNWTVEGLEGEPIDQSRVRSLLAAVKGARMVRPVGKTIKPEFGLDAPVAQVSITNDAETIDLSVGEVFGDFRYVKASGKSHVVLVRKYTLDSLLDFDPTQLIDLSQKKTQTPGDPTSPGLLPGTP